MQIKILTKILLPIIVVAAFLLISGSYELYLVFYAIGKTTTEARVIDSESYGCEYYGSRHMTELIMD